MPTGCRRDADPLSDTRIFLLRFAYSLTQGQHVVLCLFYGDAISIDGVYFLTGLGTQANAQPRNPFGFRP